MPVEIRELIVRAAVDDEDGKSVAGTSGTVERDEIVAECVEQVIEILQRRDER